MKLDNNLFDELDIEQLVSYEGLDYKLSCGTSGPQLNVKTCPKCHNDNWKVYFNADTGLGNCFVCEQRFNKFLLVKYSRGFTNNGDVYKYIKASGDTFVYRPRSPKSTFTKLNKDWKLPLNQKLLKEEEIPKYLKDRAIDLKIAERFDLRHCDAGFYTYEDHHGATKAVDFSSRIIIPIRDIDGNLVTFQGRDMTGTADKKYLFPNMLPATGAFIYNADYALANNYKKIILNEGVFDVFATTAALESDVAFKEYCACGTFGKHLGFDLNGLVQKDQLKDLYRLRENGVAEIVMLWDGEPKAIAAAMRTALKLKSFGFDDVKVGILPEGCDPAETTKEQVLKSIREAKQITELSLVRYRMLNALG